MPDDRAIAYTDGSCIGNPGPGGWGVHVQFPDGRVLERGGGELETTNNRMELRAAIEAVRLTATCPAVTVITDSQYVRRGVTQWLAGWKEKGWQRLRGRAVENQDLWSELDALTDDRLTWQWTRGHVGTVGNERADAIAGWFASGIKQLRIPSGSPPRQPVPGVHYLSLVDGVLARHATWAECERRTRGVKGARFKKIRGADEERAVVAAWGLPRDALEWI